MKKYRLIIFMLVLSIISSLIIPISADAGTIKGPSLPAVIQTTTSPLDYTTYLYKFNLTVFNPCNSNDMDKDAINEFYFDFSYKKNNGFGSSDSYRYDMSWSDGNNKNSDFLWKHFIRSNDDEYTTSFEIRLPGKLSNMHVFLNMDGGERLGFRVNSIYCNRKLISTNSDYVSSVYYDSDAYIYCSMEESTIDINNSPYFKDKDKDSITQTQINRIAKDNTASSGSLGPMMGPYARSFVDQYNGIIDTHYLDKCVAASDGDINQYYAHYDEESMYKYTFYLTVENAINLNDADFDELEAFYLDFHYIDENGYGSEKTYRLDMSYSYDLNRNKNSNYASIFQRFSDDEYKTTFDVWIPGILTKVNSTLNMRGEKLCVDIEKITVNSLAINTNRDYISSVYFDSKMEVNCLVPDSQIVGDLSNDYSSLSDQYGAKISKKLYNKAKEDPDKYLYHA